MIALSDTDTLRIANQGDDGVQLADAGWHARAATSIGGELYHGYFKTAPRCSSMPTSPLRSAEALQANPVPQRTPP